MTGETLLTRLDRAADEAAAGNGIRFLRKGGQAVGHSWTEIRARALRAAEALRRAGVEPGMRVALMLPTDPAFVDSLFGCMLLGAVPVPLYPPLRLGRLQEFYSFTAAMLEAVQACAIVVDTRVRSMVGQVLEQWRPPLGILPPELAAHPLTRTGAADLALIQFSSGTTVTPKPVALTHANILANVDAFLEVVTPHAWPDPACVSWLPLYHDMGLIGCLFGSLCSVCPLTLIPPELFVARPSIWLDAISRYRATHTAAPNFAYALCLEKVREIDLEGCDLSSLRVAMNGAEPVAAATLHAFVERFSRYGWRPEAMMPVYGLSEATLAVTMSDPHEPFHSLSVRRGALARGDVEPGDEVELVSVGRPVRHMQVAIRSPAGDLEEGRVGHVWIKGPSVTRGYFGRDDAPLDDTWLDTGDLGFRQDGSLYITGRAKDVIILRGANYSPHDIEQALQEVPGIRPGCVAAVGEVTENGERLILFAEYRRLRPELEAACRSAVLTGFGIEPGQVVLLAPGTLPRTSSGKIRRAEALRRWQCGQLRRPARVTPLYLSRELARNTLARWKRA